MDSPLKSLKVVLSWGGPDRKFLIAAIVLSVISGLLSVAPYLCVFDIMRAVYDESCSMDLIIRDALVLAITIVVCAGCTAISGMYSHKGAYNTLFRVRCDIIEHLAHAPLGELDERSTGQIKAVLLDEVEKLELFLAHNLPELFRYLVGPIAVFVFLCVVNAPLAVSTLIPFVLAFVVMGIVFKQFKLFMGRATESIANMNSVMVEYIKGMRVVKALGMGPYSFKRFCKAIDEEHAVWCQITRKTGPGYAAFLILVECGLLVTVPFGGLLFTSGQISGGVFLLFAFVGSLYLLELRSLQQLGNQIAAVNESTTKAQELLHVPVFGDGVPFPEKHGICLRDVRFAYGQTDSEVLHGVNLNVREGERLAIVGPSGCGKTTLVQLVSRFYDATSGSVSIGGVDVKDIKYDDLLSHVSIVFQHTFLSSGSIFENIAMGSGASLDDVREAARRACIDDFIAELPCGYDTEIGTLGERLSGGQRQRIAIARAILKNAPVLILDEATSSSDPENQLLIDEAIANLCEGKTVIVVAHRLGVVRMCDRVAVMAEGAITAVGTHEELLETSSYYACAWNMYNQARSMAYSFSADDTKPSYMGSSHIASSYTAQSHVSAADAFAETTALNEAENAGAQHFAGNPFAKGRDFYLSVICTVVEGLLAGVNFIIILFVMFDIFADTVTMERLLHYVGIVLAVLVVRLLVYGFGYVRGQIGGEAVSRNIRLFLGDKVRRIPLSRFTERSSGDYLNALTVNVNDYQTILTHRTPSLIKNIAMAIMITGFALSLYLPAGVLIMLAFLISIPGVWFSWRQVCKYGGVKSATSVSNTSAVIEHVSGMQTLRSYGMGGKHNDRIVESMRAYSQVSFEYEAAMLPMGGVMGAIVGIVQPALFVLCGQAWVASALEPAVFIMLIMLPLVVITTQAAIFIDLTAYKNLAIAKNRIDDVINEEEERGTFDALPHKGYDVRLENVDFAYLADEPVLRGLQLSCGDSRLTAIVGDSGSGKSTVLNLIAQYYRPDAGVVTVGGTDTTNWASESVLATMSIVDQNVFLFDDTVENNIRYARPSATDEEVKRACKLANADEFIQRMPHGYDSPIGENGERLSGGERQRLSIARAILRDSPIVLLDEATSSLDIENEIAVKEAIRNLLARRKTVIMVAHTLPIVRSADSIAVVDDGRVVEWGTHDELVAAGGKYARMWEADRMLEK